MDKKRDERKVEYFDPAEWSSFPFYPEGGKSPQEGIYIPRERLIKLGENHPFFKGWWVVEGISYASATAAAKHSGYSEGVVRRKCKSGDRGWKFIPSDKNNKDT